VFIKDLYRGMNKQAKLFKTVLLGGDTTSSGHGITISITMIGKAAAGSVVYRGGAKKGDHVYVTGTIGDSALGLLMLGSKKVLSPDKHLMKRHLDPVPRSDAGKSIARLKLAHSMIDISDGLIADLRHILTESRAGATIRLSSLPLSASYKKHCLDFSNDFYHPALCGGEDYELLFTVPTKNIPKVERLEKQLDLPMTCIGEITGKESGLVILDDERKKILLKKEGYAHF
ncbi:MAG: thiamine-phosphate kinase, partial [Pseudomonadota bacterium]